jgi:hypothetical protein
MYAGMPVSILTDQGCVFLSTEWKHACKLGKVSLRHTGTESHNSLGAGEQIHSRIRTIYNKISADHPNLQPSIILSIAVKAIATAGTAGLVPSFLVFGVPPRPPETTKDFPAQRARFEAMQTARKEYERIIAKERVLRGLNKKVTPAIRSHIRCRRSSLCLSRTHETLERPARCRAFGRQRRQ